MWCFSVLPRGSVDAAQVAWAGYLAFRGATLGDVLEDFSAHYGLAVGIRASLLIILLAVFPKVLNSNRDGWARLCWGVGADDLPVRTYTLLTISICAVARASVGICRLDARRGVGSFD